MALTFAVCGEDEAGELPEITFDMQRVVIGRAEGSDLRLPDLSVSQRHASVRQRGRDYVLIDEGSTNGTFVGSLRLTPNAPRVLQTGDVLRFGRIWVQVRFEAVPPTVHPQLATKDLALRLIAHRLRTVGELAIPKLTVMEGTNAGTTLVLEKLGHRYLLGRSIAADLVVTDENASRRQVEVWRKDAQVYVRDLGSKNGSVLDGVVLIADKSVTWPHGVSLSIGSTRIVLSDPTSEALAELRDGADDQLSDADQEELSSAGIPGSKASKRGGAPAADVGEAAKSDCQASGSRDATSAAGRRSHAFARCQCRDFGPHGSGR